MPGEVFIVGLAGPSGSGKSTVAKRVAARLNGHVISMEVYSADANHLPFEERTKRNYDAPDATDVELLGSHIRKYATGHAIEAPVYDFAQHLRLQDRRQHIPAKPLLIVEGISGVAFCGTAAALRPIDLPGRSRRCLFPSPKGEGHHGA